MTTTETTADDFRNELRAVLAEELGDETLELESFSRRGEGYSWETYLVAVTGSRSRPPRRFAVKREPIAGIVGSYNVQLEVDLLETARNHLRCPVPDVIAFRPRRGEHRGFYVMELVAGIVPMPWNVKKVIPDPEVRRRLGLELAAIMARIHSKDVRQLQIAGMAAPTDGGATGANETAKWRESYLNSAALRLPVLDLAFAWLAHRADAVSGRVSLVHYDLRVGNVIFRDGQVAAVLDWETAEFTDPVADLAMFNLPTFRGPSKFSSGLVLWDEFLDAYEAAAGWRPTEESLMFWTVLELTTAVVGCLRGVDYFDSAKANDIRYANMGFQTHHSIRWLVELFEQGAWGR